MERTLAVPQQARFGCSGAGAIAVPLATAALRTGMGPLPPTGTAILASAFASVPSRKASGARSVGCKADAATEGTWRSVEKVECLAS